MGSTGHMPWDGLLDEFYPDKRTSIKRIIYKIVEISDEHTL